MCVGVCVCIYIYITCPSYQPHQTKPKPPSTIPPGVRCPRPSAVVYAEDERDTVSNCIRKALQPGGVELVVCCIEKEARVWGFVWVCYACLNIWHTPLPTKPTVTSTHLPTP